MPAFSRECDDLSTGNACTGITQLDIPKQDSVFANGKLIARITDKTISHPAPPIPPCPNHVAQVNVGSSTVFVCGLKIARVEDSTDAGEMIEGSENVFAGG